MSPLFLFFLLAEGDLYVTIAEGLKSSLNIQTWHSKDNDDIYVTKSGHKLYNIDSININKKVKWAHGNDHSKWCVATETSWTCIADSNREESQFIRGGGALCIESEDVAKVFRDIGKVKEEEEEDWKASKKRPRPLSLDKAELETKGKLKKAR